MGSRTLRDGALLAVGAGLGVALAAYLRRQGAGGDATVGDGQVERYTAPRWAPAELKQPSQRLRLAHLPTPIHRWELPGVEPSVTEVWIKRDDCTGCELSGNKVRKLEFLLAEALAGGCDAVITVGGIQSNHCRATAAAARRVGLTPHIILRTKDPDSDPGLVGNLMLDRMVGAHIHLVSDEEFAAKGGWRLVCELKDKLEKEQGAKVYPFPSGGSNDVGTWGYIQAIAEIEQQAKDLAVEFDAVYYACGSGGTGAGLALGMHASSLQGELVGLCVDDTPQECVRQIV
jgi:1-aminocyclopropane-1-carboxylate deaminase/D-cysteine desulfhydrase-like pyridoxal-dependent ACC family enzyme